MNFSPQMLQALMSGQGGQRGIVEGEHDQFDKMNGIGKYGMGALGMGMNIGGGLKGLTSPGLLMGLLGRK